MGFRIDTNTNRIDLTRGDTLKCTVGLTKDGTAYTLDNGDSVRFVLKHAAMNPRKTAYVDNAPVIEKTIPVATMGLELDPDDTKELSFGKYVYDVEVTFEDESVDTVINNAEFNIVPEVD